MIHKELEKIVTEERMKGNSDIYIRNLLKGYLQVYALNYIYTTSEYAKELIFTGGTCLRHLYNLGRLSEDLDFDYNNQVDTLRLAKSLQNYFEVKYKMQKVSVSVKQEGKQILLKFPLLKDLNIAKSQESDMLYLKLDLQKNPSEVYDVQVSSKNLMGFNFVTRHYDLPTLMTGKIVAVLTRERFVGKGNRGTIKGRDYYDLLWYLKKQIEPNMIRLPDILGRNISKKELKKELDEKVKLLLKDYRNDFESDLLPLIENSSFVFAYVQNYGDEYKRESNYLLK
jgi:predicted nucleotidyltransferase component of viral defense system